LPNPKDLPSSLVQLRIAVWTGDTRDTRPEPDDGDEDDDPLFDSTREYVEQIDRYKEHQGKPITVPKKSYSRSPAMCTVCGEAFAATSRNKTLTCSPSCLKTLVWRTSRPDKIACSICGEPFQSIRGAKVCPKKDCRNAARRKTVSQQGPVSSPINSEISRLRDQSQENGPASCTTPSRSSSIAIWSNRNVGLHYA
jgi:hypothetical protein